MRLNNTVGLFLVLVHVMASVARADGPPSIQFSRDILPILSQNCFQCHGPDEKSRKAKLRLDTEDGARAVVVPGKSGQSELMRRIHAAPGEEGMPPTSTNRKLTSHEQHLIELWIDSGARWSKHWAYDPPQQPTLPTHTDTPGIRNGIDHFIRARLSKEGLSASGEASKATLIRRVSLDLTGLPPSVAEVDAFLHDESPLAYEKVVDRLLASPRFGERMAMDWLDLARFADTNGYQNDFARTMWPWRNWVIDALNHNMPFDQFVIEQIAGDLLPSATLSQRIATGFNRNNRTVTEAGSIDEEWRVENAVDRVETTATVFLGLTMGCARCHDHKFDPISQREFYQFYAFFNSIDERGVYTETRGNVAPLIMLPTPADQKRLQQLDSAIAAMDRIVSDLDKTVATHADLKSRFENDAKSLKGNLAKLRQDRAEFEKKIPSVMVMEDAKSPRETFVLKRGRYDMPDRTQKVSAAVPACLPPMAPGQPPNRLGLARWLMAPNHPLTSRVTVNRFWEHFFGTGLVKTAENFGLQSEPPSHPELLDWLALRFIDSQWNVKAVIRLIVTSATYRQASAASVAVAERDPENRLLSHGPRFRLPAEVVRDNALAVSGLLREQLGGPSIKPYQPAGLWEELAGGAGEGPYVQDQAPNLYRRSLYIYRKRTVPYPGMTIFDAPTREVCQVKRTRTNTPLQALELLNDVTYLEASRNLALQMIVESGATPRDRITYAFRRATARVPKPAELDILVRGWERHRQSFRESPDTAKQFLHHGASTIGEPADPADMAAYAAIASVILNLDETITKE